jgi:hypothetical protein
MAIFDYGKELSTEKYMYQYIAPLEVGYYPVENLVKKCDYDDVKPSEEYGSDVPAYGELHYSKPLTAAQISSYNLLKMTKSLVDDVSVEQTQEPEQTQDSDKSLDDFLPFEEPDTTSVPKAAATKPAESNAQELVSNTVRKNNIPNATAQYDNAIILHNVQPNRLFTSKDGKFKVFSMVDSRSDTGYSNYVVKATDVAQNSDSTYEVYLGNAGQVRNLSIIQNKQRTMLRVPIESIEQQYKDTLMTSPETAENARKGKENPRNNAFLNNVDRKFVYDTKNPKCKIVSVPYAGSENGYAKVTVPTRNIFDTKLNGKTVPNHVNVNIGPKDNMIPLSVLRGGKYERIQMQAGDLADLQQRAVERWRAQSMQVADAMPADEKQGSVDVEEEPFA